MQNWVGLMYKDFFMGNVRFISQGIFSAKYSIMDNDSIIKVSNSKHVRMIENQFGEFPHSFEIIAHLDAVTLIQGEIPYNCIRNMDISSYRQYQTLYQGF